jgi:hypothetical protein
MNPLSEEQKTYENFLRILRRSTELLIDDPVKEEIFSVERLEQHATYLATEFKLNLKSTSGRSLVPELRQCEKQLYQSHHQLGEVIRGRHEVSPAVEWFLDNFYIIEEQLTGIKRDLPKSYYRASLRVIHAFTPWPYRFWPTLIQGSMKRP